MVTDGPTIVVDAGGLIAVERGTRVMQQVVRETADADGRLIVPAPVLGQVWRGGARQAVLARFLKLHCVEVDLLTRAAWLSAGVACGHAGTSSDVVDAAVVVCARAREAGVVVTSDPDDLRRLDHDLAYWVP